MRPTVLLLIMWAACIGKRGMLVAATDESRATLTAGSSRSWCSASRFPRRPSPQLFFEPARRAFDWLAGLSRRMPFWTGIVLIGPGLWSVWFGLYVTPQPPA